MVKDVIRPASLTGYCPIDRSFNILHPRFGGDLSATAIELQSGRRESFEFN
jgi:hypothetical protein